MGMHMVSVFVGMGWGGCVTISLSHSRGDLMIFHGCRMEGRFSCIGI